jgi:hypothetical protein
VEKSKCSGGFQPAALMISQKKFPKTKRNRPNPFCQKKRGNKKPGLFLHGQKSPY